MKISPSIILYMNVRERITYSKFLFFLGMIVFGASFSANAQFDEQQFFNKNKNKKPLVVAVKEEPPFIMKDSSGAYYGLSIDLWEHLAKKMDVDYKYKDLGSVYAIVTSLNRGDEVDVSISPLTATPTRIAAFDVSQPFFISSLGVAISTEHGGGVFSNIFTPKIIELLAYVVFVIVATGTAMWFLEKRRNSIEFAEDPKEGWIDGIWWAAVTMTTVGYGDKIPKTRSGKLLALIWMFTSIILISSLTASITSELSRNGNRLEIKKVDELDEISDKVGTVAYSSSADYLATHKIKLRPEYCYDTPIDGLKALEQGEITVFVYDKPIMYYLLTENNLEEKIEIMPVTFNKNYCCFMMPKDSGLLKDLNPELVQKTSESAWIRTLRKYNLGENTTD